jgi:hypothetical protein
LRKRWEADESARTSTIVLHEKKIWSTSSVARSSKSILVVVMQLGAGLYSLLTDTVSECSDYYRFPTSLYLVVYLHGILH